MARVSPYPTNSMEYPPKYREVYHDHDDCPDGKRIKREHRENGTGNTKRCDACIKLGWFIRARKHSMRTRGEIEHTAHVLGDERWQIWMECGVHNWQALPRIESGEHYCPTCCTIWAADGAIQKAPTKPITRR